MSDHDAESTLPRLRVQPLPADGERTPFMLVFDRCAERPGWMTNEALDQLRDATGAQSVLIFAFEIDLPGAVELGEEWFLSTLHTTVGRHALVDANVHGD